MSPEALVGSNKWPGHETGRERLEYVNQCFLHIQRIIYIMEFWTISLVLVMRQCQVALCTFVYSLPAKHGEARLCAQWCQLRKSIAEIQINSGMPCREMNPKNQTLSVVDSVLQTRQGSRSSMVPSSMLSLLISAKMIPVESSLIHKVSKLKMLLYVDLEFSCFLPPLAYNKARAD